MAPRRSRIGRQQPSEFLVDIDDRFGAAKLERQALVVTQQLGVSDRQQMGGIALSPRLNDLSTS